MSAVVTAKRRRPTEKEIIAAGIERSNAPEPWRTCMLAECSRGGRYSSARVAAAVLAAVQLQREVDSALEYSAAIRKGPRGRRPITSAITRPNNSDISPSDT
jgi:hypothetical protein